MPSILYVNLCILSICSGLVYCMDYLEKNLDWLKDKLEPLEKGMKVQFYNVKFLPVYKCIITINRYNTVSHLLEVS